MISRLKTHLRDVRDYFWFPFWAAVLPQSFVYDGLKRRLLRSGAYIEEATTTILGRQRVQLHLNDDAALHDDFRFLKLLANADMIRVALGRRSRETSIDFGDLRTSSPPSQGALVLSIHWGSALPVLRQFSQQCGPVHFVIAPPSSDEAINRPVRSWLATLSVSVIERATGAPCIVTGSSRDEIVTALHAGRNVCMLYDVPAHLVRQSKVQRAGEMSFQLPYGYAEIAAQTGVPVVFFAACPSPTAANILHTMVRPAQVFASADELLTASAEFLKTCLLAEPAGWHMWQHSREIFAVAHHVADGGLTGDNCG